MTFAEFLEKEELTETSFNSIIHQCEPLNYNLKNFLRTNPCESLPLTVKQEFVNGYNESIVNLKTGKIVEPASGLSDLEILTLKKATITLSLMDNPKEVTAYVDMYLVMLDEHDQYITHVYCGNPHFSGIAINSRTRMSPAEATLTFLSYKGDARKEIAQIDLDHVHSKVHSIHICAFANNAGYKKGTEHFSGGQFTITMFHEGYPEAKETPFPLPCKKTLNEKGGIHAFSIVRNDNEWVVNIINRSLSDNPNEFISDFLPF